MNIFSLFTLCGGLAFFLYGMTVMSKSLEKMAGGKLERLLKRMTSNPIKSLLLGAGITIAIQSSSAMTVMLVGLVNSGVMEIGQTIGIIMGSNIGTTLTAWLLSLTGIESENFFVNFLKPKNFSPLLALIGILLIMGSKRQRRRDVGRVMMGFSILMYGMELMSGAVSPLADMPGFTHFMTAFTNPFLGVLVGAAFTGIIQSSAASVGILQALAMTGSVTYGIAIPIIMGQNIGTCVTALISSIGVSRNAKRVSVIHISFNLIGTALGLLALFGGEIYVKGEKVHIRTPKDAIKRKIAFLTEDRKGQGLVLNLDVRTNLVLANMKGFSNGPFLDKDRIEQAGNDNVSALKIKTPSLNEVVGQLSGGNQQKVVIGKWVNTDADIFIFDEPTRGIDVGAKIEVYRVMNDLVKAGKCVIMVSSELPEILAMSDHVVVMRGGRVMADIDRDTPHFNSEDIMKAAWGGELD